MTILEKAVDMIGETREERMDWIRDNLCPGYFGYKNMCCSFGDEHTCEECWNQEVEEEKDHDKD